MDTLISILGGAIWNHHGVWQTTELAESDDHIIVASDHFRVLAGALLYKKNPQRTTLLVQGGLAESNKPSIASVIKAELEILDIPGDRILLEDHSITTFSQLFELKLIAAKLQPKHLLILSNEWHLPRIEAMIKWNPELRELSKRSPELCAAEEVLIQESEKDWQAIIEAVRLRDDMIARISKEKQGVDQIQKGTYKYR